MNVKTKKAEQSKLTRAALLKAARALFTERGYADTPTEEIVKRAGVTRGALYYQFRDKSDLFLTVLEELNQELIQNIAQAMQSGSGDLWDKRVRTGCAAFLDGCLDPSVQRILLIDGPSVLGWEVHRRLEEEYGLGIIRQTLQEVLDAGLIEPQPVEPLAQLLLGALDGAAIYIAQSEDVQTARREMGASLDRLLDGLRVGR